MSRIGNPYDNAKAESFMKTLKQEEINGNSYRNLSQARGAIGAFIETIYNRQRLHSALAYRSPDEYEATLGRFPGVTHRPKSRSPRAVTNFASHPRGAPQNRNLCARNGP
jgi:putative transposase